MGARLRIQRFRTFRPPSTKDKEPLRCGSAGPSKRASSLALGLGEFALEGLGQTPCNLRTLRLFRGLDHHLNEGFRAGRADEYAALSCQRLGLAVDGLPELASALQGIPVTHPHVQQDLRELLH